MLCLTAILTNSNIYPVYAATFKCVLILSPQKHRCWQLYSNGKNGLQQFQMESCRPIKRLKDKKKIILTIYIYIYIYIYVISLRGPLTSGFATQNLYTFLFTPTPVMSPTLCYFQPSVIFYGNYKLIYKINMYAYLIWSILLCCINIL